MILHVANKGCRLACVLSVLIGVAPARSDTPVSDEDVIAYRQHIMKSNSAQAAAIGQILSLAIPDDNLAKHFEALLLTTRAAKAAFAPRVVGGGSLPAVWENPEDFAARLKESEDNLAKALKALQEQGMGSGTIGEYAIESMNSCKTCHDVYRKKP